MILKIFTDLKHKLLALQDLRFDEGYCNNKTKLPVSLGFSNVDYILNVGLRFIYDVIRKLLRQQQSPSPS